MGSGCDRYVRYQLETRLYDKDTGKPLPHVPVDVQWVWQPEVWGNDLRWGEENFKDNIYTRRGTTDENGIYSSDIGLTIGGGFRSVPPPHYLVRLGAQACQELWGITFLTNEELEIRKYAPTTGLKVDISKEEENAVSGSTKSEGAENKSTAVFRIDQKKACSEAQTLASTSHRKKPGRNVAFFSYGDRLPHGVGVGYLRSIAPYDWFRLEVPLSASGGSYSVATLIKWRLLPVWRLTAAVALGPEFDHVDSMSFPGPNYLPDDSGIHFAFTAGVDYSPRNGLYMEAGFSSVTLGKDRRSEHPYVRLGWVF